VPDPDPLFVVGRRAPDRRSSSRSSPLTRRSKGTHEIAEPQRIVLEISRKRSDPGDPVLHGVKETSYLGVLTELAPEDFCALGERYMMDTRAYRRHRPFFVDKMPNNFRHVGLIHLMLPKAKIIDVRREPLACCFSNLKRLFARGQEFTYSMGHISRYYRTYLELMRHWDTVLPGRIRRVCTRSSWKISRETWSASSPSAASHSKADCVQFRKTERAVPRASSEQGSPADFSTWAFPVEELRAPRLGPLKGRFGRRTDSIRE
jgi:hypothetical protein